MLVLALATTALAVLTLLPFYCLHWCRRARLTRHLPGPTPWPLVGNALELGSGPVELVKNIERLWRQYGNIFKLSIGPEFFVLLADPHYLEVLMSCNVNISKGLQYQFLYPWLGSGLLTSGGKKWRKHRKIITPAFHFKILEKFVETFHSNCDVLLKKLDVHSSRPAFDIYEYVTLCALDIICETTFGVSVNAQENSQSKYVQAVKGMSIVVMARSFNPLLFSNIIFRWSDVGMKQEKYLNVLHKTTQEVINTRKDQLRNTELPSSTQDNIGIKTKLAFLDLLLSYSKDGGNFTDEEIREEVDTFMFEGHDTVSSAITYCLWLLSLHLDIQEKVCNEMNQIFKDSSRKSTFRDLQDMKYLECVIKETLRLFPSVPFYGRRLDEDVEIGGHLLPAGTNVGFLAYCVHRNPDIYPEPEKFDPDRFLPENSVGRHPFAFLAFSAGPRNCIGQKFAMLEMKAIISGVLRKYRLLASQDVELEISWEIVIRSPKGVFLRLEPRT